MKYVVSQTVTYQRAIEAASEDDARDAFRATPDADLEAVDCSDIDVVEL